MLFINIKSIIWIMESCLIQIIEFIAITKHHLINLCYISGTRSNIVKLQISTQTQGFYALDYQYKTVFTR